MRTTLPLSTRIICDRLLLTTFNTGDVEAPPPIMQVRQLITLNPAYSIPDIVAIGYVFSHITPLVFQASIRIFSFIVLALSTATGILLHYTTSPVPMNIL